MFEVVFAIVWFIVSIIVLATVYSKTCGAGGPAVLATVLMILILAMAAPYVKHYNDNKLYLSYLSIKKSSPNTLIICKDDDNKAISNNWNVISTYKTHFIFQSEIPSCTIIIDSIPFRCKDCSPVAQHKKLSLSG